MTEKPRSDWSERFILKGGPLPKFKLRCYPPTVNDGFGKTRAVWEGYKVEYDGNVYEHPPLHAQDKKKPYLMWVGKIGDNNE